MTGLAIVVVISCVHTHPQQLQKHSYNCGLVARSNMQNFITVVRLHYEASDRTTSIKQLDLKLMNVFAHSLICRT